MQLRRARCPEEELQGYGVGGKVEQKRELRDDSVRLASAPAPLDRAQNEEVACVGDCHRGRRVPTRRDEPIDACPTALDLGLDVLAFDPGREDSPDCVEDGIAQFAASDHAHVAEQIAF